jgi:hypothetical protein
MPFNRTGGQEEVVTNAGGFVDLEEELTHPQFYNATHEPRVNG